MFQIPLSVGRLNLKNRLFLAPLAGVSDPPFRRICEEMGAALTYVEMLSASAIIHRNQRTVDMRKRHLDEGYLGVQVTGANPDEIAAAVSLLDKEHFDTIDLNMGCPVRKIVNKGWGAAYLKSPVKIAETVEKVRARTCKPLSVKIRLGFDRHSVNVEEVCSIISKAGADMVTVHGRTRCQSYETPADLEKIRLGLKAASQNCCRRTVLVANGDVLDLRAAVRTWEKTKCDAVMISRGALGNPWIFKEILSGQTYRPTLQEWEEVVLRHLEYHEAYYGPDRQASVLARKVLAWYASGFPRIRELRVRLSEINSLSEARSLIRQYVAKCTQAKNSSLALPR